MKNINNSFTNFIEKIKIIKIFINEYFGETNVLMLKNKGVIQSRNMDVLNNNIKGYVFHGTGCDFRFKNEVIDIEFDEDEIGFTHWSFYIYTKSIYPDINENEIINFLNSKVIEKKLIKTNKIYKVVCNEW